MEIRLTDIKKSFGGKTVLDIDSFAINSGDVIGLVGNNGAGKTTMFRVILDLIKPDVGTVSIDGVNPALSEAWKDFTGAYVDSGFLVDFLTPEEYFSFIAKISGVGKNELGERLAKFEGFMNGEIMGQNTLVRNLSMGNRQKVGIIAAMLTRPEFLILDEPFNFLDPSSQLAMKHVIREYSHETGAAVIVSSHNLTHTIDICTRVALLENGKIVRDYDKQKEENVLKEIEEYFIGNIK